MNEMKNPIKQSQVSFIRIKAILINFSIANCDTGLIFYFWIINKADERIN